MAPAAVQNLAALDGVGLVGGYEGTPGDEGRRAMMRELEGRRAMMESESRKPPSCGACTVIATVRRGRGSIRYSGSRSTVVDGMRAILLSSSCVNPPEA